MQDEKGKLTEETIKENEKLEKKNEKRLELIKAMRDKDYDKVKELLREAKKIIIEKEQNEQTEKGIIVIDTVQKKELNKQDIEDIEKLIDYRKNKNILSDCMLNNSKINDQEPEPLKWIIPQKLPAGIVGAIIGAGGIGKSFFCLHMALALSSNKKLFGFIDLEMNEAKKVLCFFGEDNKNQIHHRIKNIMNKEGVNLNSNIQIFSMDGMNTALIEQTGKYTEIKQTELFKTIKEKIKEFQPDIIFIDPASRFSAGDENDNRTATRFIQSLEELKNATDKEKETTLIFCHHKRKGKEGDEKVDLIRGASALKDGARWILYFSQDDKNEKDKFKTELIKSNYVKKDSFNLTLERLDNGVLADYSKEYKGKQSKEKKQETDIFDKKNKKDW